MLLLFAGVAGFLLTIILFKVGKLRRSPQLAFAPEQPVDFERGGSYALWLTGGRRGFGARLLPEADPDIRLIAATGDEVAISRPLFAPLIRGFGTYRQVATFSIARPGRYTLRIVSPGTQAAGASTARLILARRRG
jgi:hypothetical protein